MKQYIHKIALTIAALMVAHVAWGDKWTTDKASGNHTLESNVTITSKIVITGELTITATGNFTIKAGANLANIFEIQDGGKLTLKGEPGKRITIDGGATFAGGKTFTSDYIKNEPSGYKLGEGSGAVIQNSNGTLNMYYVTIQNVNGKGIFITGINNGEERKTNLNNCTIQNCSGPSAIHVNNKNTNNKADAEKCCLIANTTTIQNCYNTDGTIRANGSTVANLYLTDVIVKDNYTEGSGCGIYWNGKGTDATKCVFNGCTFENNVAKTRGAGMMLETTFSFEGDTTFINSNKVLSEDGTGGGIYIKSYEGNAMAVVSDNHYNFDYVFSEAVKITNNTASQGGGVSFELINFTLNGDWKENDNSSRKITLDLNIDGAIISGNKATTGYGGGIYFLNKTEENKGNRTVNINVYVNKGEISHNEAATDGAGLYLYNADIENKYEGGELNVSSNKAPNGNGAHPTNPVGQTYRSNLKLLLNDT